MPLFGADDLKCSGAIPSTGAAGAALRCVVAADEIQASAVAARAQTGLPALSSYHDVQDSADESW